MRTQFRKIFTQMGFEEMPTNNYVESSFWNFDVLFQPQQHPARDAHDTFFLTHPPSTHEFPEEYLQRVKVGMGGTSCACSLMDTDHHGADLACLPAGKKDNYTC